MTSFEWAAAGLGLLVAAGGLGLWWDGRQHRDDVPDGMCTVCAGPWDAEHHVEGQCPTGMIPDGG